MYWNCCKCSNNWRWNRVPNSVRTDSKFFPSSESWIDVSWEHTKSHVLAHAWKHRITQSDLHIHVPTYYFVQIEFLNRAPQLSSTSPRFKSFDSYFQEKRRFPYRNLNFIYSWRFQHGVALIFFLDVTFLSLSSTLSTTAADLRSKRSKGRGRGNYKCEARSVPLAIKLRASIFPSSSLSTPVM